MYPTMPHNDIPGAKKKLTELIKKHHVNTIAIGNVLSDDILGPSECFLGVQHSFFLVHIFQMSIRDSVNTADVSGLTSLLKSNGYLVQETDILTGHCLLYTSQRESIYDTINAVKLYLSLKKLFEDFFPNFARSNGEIGVLAS